MTRRPAFLAALCCLFFFLTALAQEGKVIIVNSGSKELKRTAHRFRITVEQLKNARSALQDATDLAHRLNPIPASQVGDLAQQWTEIHRPKAAAAIEGVLQDVRIAALKGSDLETYRECATAARALLPSLAVLDFDKAIQLIRQWPRPPASSGEAGEKVLDDLQTQSRADIVRRLSFSDPEKALQLSAEAGFPPVPDFMARARMAQSLMFKGQKEDALKLVDQAVSDFAERKTDPLAVQDYLGFIMILPSLDPDRFLSALAQLPEPSPNEVPKLALMTAGQNVPLTMTDRRLVMVLRGLRTRPELLIKAVNAVPGLKSKADQAGGIDQLMSAGVGPYSNPYYSGQIRSGSSGSQGAPASPDSRSDDPRSLLEELRGKAEKDPGFVRQRLSEAARGPRPISLLIDLAQIACYQDPELGSLAIEVAKPLLSRVQPLRERASDLSSMVGASRSCDGEADAGLLREGFIFVDQLREEGKSAVSEGQSGPQQPDDQQTDELESLLVAELARDDFESARRYVRSMPDNKLKLMVLLHIVQLLHQGD